MAEKISIDFKGKGMFQGTSTMVTVTYTGDNTHQITSNTKILSKVTSTGTGTPKITVSEYEDSHRQKTPNTTEKTLTVPFKIDIDYSENKSPFTLEFTVDIAGSKLQNNTFTYSQMTTDDIQPLTFAPLLIGSHFLEDFQPATATPQASNSFLEMNLSPRDKGGNILPGYQIALELNDKNHILLFDSVGSHLSPYQAGTPLYPYNDGLYYLNVDPSGNIDVKFYAKKVNNGYTKIISLKTTMGETVFTGDNMLFVTEHLLPTDGVSYPRIPDLVGGKLIPQQSSDVEDESVFSVKIPELANYNTKDILFVMNKNSDGDAVCVSGEYGSDLEIPYASITQLGYNELYYYINNLGITYKSGSLFFDLAGNKPPNKPPFNGTLDKVLVIGSDGEPISDYDNGINDNNDYYVNADNIDGGLKYYISIGGENQPKIGDTISVNIKINGYDPDTGAPLPPLNKNLIEKKRINNGDVHDKKLENSILPAFLRNWGASSDGHAGHIYLIYYITNKKEKSKVWTGLIDTVALGGSN
ncbi:hypothetical protein J8V57_02815 [Xenorhabdus sp. PB61.4]|uniref:hypothetical protein n=1 Tax=Xenorhabdus sp. PB61.4 TaxID=2788940 RepID=UPI001E327AAF|nr:hypothetical protein [Xenorhabdus sp. PB61.4]MCC8365217.1 hypothetical protein [Xenorhabdus sp. PB61.4]